MSAANMTTDITAVRWDPMSGEVMEEYEYDGGNSSSRLFERSRIKALAGQFTFVLSLHLLVHELEQYKSRDMT